MSIRTLLLASSVLGLCSPNASADIKASIARGEHLYLQKCQVCHQATGVGVPGVFPPLAKSDFLTNDRERSIRAICEGLSGKITVNGVEYAGQMPAQPLDDASVADVLNFVGASWGNAVRPFDATEVAAVRARAPNLRVSSKNAHENPGRTRSRESPQ